MTPSCNNNPRWGGKEKRTIGTTASTRFSSITRKAARSLSGVTNGAVGYRQQTASNLRPRCSYSSSTSSNTCAVVAWSSLFFRCGGTAPTHGPPRQYRRSSCCQWDHHLLKQTTVLRSFDAVRQNRSSAKRSDVLIRNSFRTTSRGNNGECFHRTAPLCYQSDYFMR